MKKHQKHTALARPALGAFGRNEWAIIGTPCGNIKKLASQITGALSKKWKVGYVDADHVQSATNAEADLIYTDKISFHRFDMKGQFEQFQFRPIFNSMDAVIVNGNHFKAKKQVVVIDPKKEESLSRKLDRLTDVQMILLTEGMDAPFGFLKKHIPEIDEIPVFKITDIERIVSFFHKKMSEAIPPVNGLVLVGGKSQRMGRDKGLLDYHGMPQRLYMANLLDGLCEKTYLSCRPDQMEELAGKYPLLPDTFAGLGPMGAILSAFREQPGAAWLVVACDLPLLDKSTLQFLLKNRNPSEMATTFRSPVNQFPEPLVTIWEPRSYPVLLQFLAQGYSCPRKALINSPVQILEAPRADALRNVNTVEELEEVMGRLEAGGKYSNSYL
ncbi:MAG TPA: molybdopterin-guanine dinucleotide biosynthesis protein MobA [Bacteroidetes bacterium]|nr:molybdopterin-guanine dinucleotide biosynthesis protein MobA [Bacteroidota bacterium]